MSFSSSNIKTHGKIHFRTNNLHFVLKFHSPLGLNSFSIMAQDNVTLAVVKMLIQNQAEAFKLTFVMFIQDVKDELKSVKTEINDLKVSLQFTQAQVDEDPKKADIST